MTEEKIQHNTNCEDAGHEEHLCHLMYQGLHLNKPEQYKAIVQNAQFRCQNCGRTAASDKNLCSPIKL